MYWPSQNIWTSKVTFPVNSSLVIYTGHPMFPTLKSNCLWCAREPQHTTPRHASGTQGKNSSNGKALRQAPFHSCFCTAVYYVLHTMWYEYVVLRVACQASSQPKNSLWAWFPNKAKFIKNVGIYFLSSLQQYIQGATELGVQGLFLHPQISKHKSITSSLIRHSMFLEWWNTTKSHVFVMPTWQGDCKNIQEI